MSNSVNLPAPFGGIDEQTPIAAVRSPFCQELVNFNVTEAGINLRKGDSIFESINAGFDLDSIKVLGKYGEANLFVLVYDLTATQIKIFDVEAGTLVYTSAALGSAEFQPQYFNKYLYFFTSNAAYDPGVSWNGTVWAVIGYTGSGFLPKGGGNVYNNRNYIIQDSEAAYWYSGIDSVTGALTKVDLSGIVSQKCTLSNISTLTLSDQLTTKSLQVFCMSNGEILFYEGSYPDSPSWSLVARAKVGQLVSKYNSVFAYQGDGIILSDNGIASLRDLFLRGSNNALNLSINKRVQKTWMRIIKAARDDATNYDGPISSRIKGIWDDINSRIIIYLPFDYNLQTGAFDVSGNFFFIYDTLTQSWTYHKSQSGEIEFIDLEYYKNKVILLPLEGGPGSTTINLNEKEGSTGFEDRNAENTANFPYDFRMLSAPIPFPKTQVYQVTGIEPILESDLYDETNYNLIGDFGRVESGDQKTTAITTAPAKPFVNVGLEANFVQLEISGTTAASKTVGLDLYSYNIWFDSGDKGSR